MWPLRYKSDEGFSKGRAQTKLPPRVIEIILNYPLITFIVLKFTKILQMSIFRQSGGTTTVRLAAYSCTVYTVMRTKCILKGKEDQNPSTEYVKKSFTL